MACGGLIVLNANGNHDNRNVRHRRHLFRIGSVLTQADSNRRHPDAPLIFVPFLKHVRKR